VTYPLPQRGKLEKDQPPCPVCRAPVVTAIEAGRPPWTLCINPECPTRIKKAEEKAERMTAAKAKKAATARKAASVKRARAKKKESTPPAVTPAAVPELPAPTATSPATRKRVRRTKTPSVTASAADSDIVPAPP